MKTKSKAKTNKKGDKKMKQKTYVALVLDQSGSMSAIRKNAVEGYNEQIQQMKLNAKDQEIFCSLVTFNGDVYEHQWLEKADNLNEAVETDYPCNGSTAFRDAIGHTIKRLQETTDGKEENIGYLVIVISDGEENASKHVHADALREQIESCQRTGKWTFSYMGCNAAYVEKVAKETSIPKSNMAVWSTNSAKSAARGLHMNAARVGSYYRARAGGQSATEKLYSDVECCMADYTDDSAAAASVDVNNLAKSVGPIDNLGLLKTPDVVPNLLVRNEVRTGESPFSNVNSPVKWS